MFGLPEKMVQMGEMGSYPLKEDTVFPPRIQLGLATKYLNLISLCRLLLKLIQFLT